MTAVLQKPHSQPKAVVIGSGFGGLAAAIRLQSRGFQVTLLEKREHTGGRAYRLEMQGYTFDMGPSLITMPSLLEKLFVAAGTTFAQAVPTLALDPYYRIYFHDKTFLDYSGDREKMMEQMRVFNPKDAANYDIFMRAIKPIYEAVIDKGLGATPFDNWKTMARFVPTVMRLSAWKPVTLFVAKYFKDFRNRFAFSFHPLYIGGNPFRAPSVYLMIPFLERKEGVWYAPGGMYSVIQALEKAFVNMGGVVKTNHAVTEIVTEGRHAQGVKVSNNNSTVSFPAELIVSNADITHTYSKLLQKMSRKKWTDKKLSGIAQTMSCFLIFVGLRKRYPELKHHTLILSERYKGLIQDIFDHKTLPDDFSLYLHAPTRTDDSMAPPNCESLFILAPVANLASGLDWEKIKTSYTDKILTFLEEWGLKDLHANIECQKLFTPNDFSHELNATLGNAFGIEPKLLQTGYFRPHNRSEELDNLFLVGAGTHPGAGVPGVLLSAEATENSIIQHFPHLMRASNP